MESGKNKRGLEKYGISDEEFERQYREATKRGEWAMKNEPRAASASYKDGEVTVRLLSGWSFSFDPRRFKFFKDATEAELAEVRPMGQGFALEWETLDQHLGVGSLILDLIGNKYLVKELGRRNGAVTSERKRIASRKNGKLGGRPKKAA
ncbi:MAG: DUF2442 domain-containing protein [Acidobacteria bacterium ACB1]|nr:hypothetical protein [Pyrinomonadaceae bacterium]MCE7963673.1 DUF2442 domain-containing protein [Acidobacteria bacterium ACB1]RIJ94187.1 MAG: DUF2442 domain-containing protein [Acidobacteriota bacterium]